MTERHEEGQDALNALERLALSEALSRDYEAFLAPGEKIAVRARYDAGWSWAHLALASADGTFRLDLEAGFSQEDFEAGMEQPKGRAVASKLIEFLRVQLYEFFRQDRGERPPVDWRLYAYEGLPVRYRGERSSPALEQAADALLGGEA